MKKLGVFLEIFSGVGGVSRALRKRGIDTESIDVLKHADDDMLVTANQRRVLRMIRTNRVSGVWLGTPCTSLTRARHGTPGSGWPEPLRSSELPDGLPNLSDKDSQKVVDGNKLLEFSARVIKLCIRMKIPVAVENPCTSFLWWTTPFAQLYESHPPHERNFDFCSYRKPWRKRTRLWSWHLCLERVGKICSSKQGICDFTGKPHSILKGTLNGQFLSKIAEPYPAGMCAQVAHSFVETFEDQIMYGMWRAVSGITKNV